MDAKTLAALRGSIKKWQAILAGTGNDHGTANCPLCQMFYNNKPPADEDSSWEGCYGCPVAMRTKTEGCSNTPYTAWTLASREAENAIIGSTQLPHKIIDEKVDERLAVIEPQQRDAARAELDFLVSLLPKGELP